MNQLGYTREMVRQSTIDSLKSASTNNIPSNSSKNDNHQPASTNNIPSMSISSSASAPTAPRAQKRNRPDESMKKLSYAEVTKSQTHDQLISYFMEQNQMLLKLMSEKDIQIAALNDIIKNLQEEKRNQYLPIEGSYIPNVSNVQTGEYSKTIVVTNINEQIDEHNADALDKNAMIDLIKEIDPTVSIESIKRMGRKDAKKTRPIQVKLATKADKKNILDKSPAYIKSKPNLVAKKTFINNMLSPESHKMQMKLWNKLKEYRKQNSNQLTVKYFIKRNQIYVDDTQDLNSPPARVQDTVNDEAALFYKLS